MRQISSLRNWPVPFSIRLFAIGMPLYTTSLLVAGDWPQILGPRRTAIASADERIRTNWRSGGPPLLWQRQVGDGFAGVAVAADRVVLFHRVDGREIVEAMDAASGNRLWDYGYATDYRCSYASDSGPRCVPLIHDGRVYLHGAAGRLSCVALDTGKLRWQRETKQDFRFPEGYFGQGSSPLIEDQALLVNVGGRGGSGIVAFHVDTGDTLWRATDERASYSSPVSTTVDDVKHVLFITRFNVLSMDPRTGAIRFQFPFGKRGPTVNAANPVVIGRQVFLTSAYGVGAALLRIEADRAAMVWRKPEVMSSQYCTGVVHDGVLYGFDGRDDTGPRRLSAIDPIRGRIYWSKDDFGYGSVIRVGETLALQTSSGELVLAKATPERYTEFARARLMDSTTRALPALSNGRYFVRDTETLKCFELATQ